MAISASNYVLTALGLVVAVVTLLISRIYWIYQDHDNAPLRSGNNEKKGGISKRPTPAPVYKDTFPPSTSHMLRDAANSLPEARKVILNSPRCNSQDFKKRIIPFDADYRQCGPPTYTPMGISIEEVEALGDFPDYATLSDVPLPEPHHNFDITKAKARPYRPFRWKYHQTMALSKLEPNYWLELESTYASRIFQRKKLYETQGTQVLNYLPGSELACKETMELALQFLTTRYPTHFSLTHDPKKNMHTFHNHILQTSTPTKSKHPLEILMENVPEDFAIMIRDPSTGLYHLRAAVLCSSLGWTVATKLGLSLAEIHAPIPGYNAPISGHKLKMAPSMDRYFAEKIPANEPIQRGSWGLEVDQPLFMPPGDPHEAHRERQDPDLELERLHLRVDWQTLRRLPLSGAVVFNFKALFTRVSDFRNEPYIPSLLYKVLTEGSRDIMEYKNTWHVEHKVLPLLEQWAREQEASGMIEKDWEIGTLKESPFFPGWEGPA